MAQKALKTLAAKNTATLNRTHLIALAIHLLYHTVRLVFFRSRRLLPYTLCVLPSVIIEVWFERIARPTHDAQGELRRAGEDLEAKGLTEWMWDVLYWTWACVVLVTAGGDRAWWAYIVVPLYTIYAAFGVYSGVRGGVGGLMGQGSSAEVPGGAAGQSKRQAKLEKRGGQKVQYR